MIHSPESVFYPISQVMYILTKRAYSRLRERAFPETRHCASVRESSLDSPQLQHSAIGNARTQHISSSCVLSLDHWPSVSAE